MQISAIGSCIAYVGHSLFAWLGTQGGGGGGINNSEVSNYM